MKKAFEQNVSRARPRVKLGSLVEEASPEEAAPAASDSAAVPVRGDFPMAANRQDAARGEPVITPVAKIRRFSNENGSILGGTSFMR